MKQFTRNTIKALCLGDHFRRKQHPIIRGTNDRERK